jgi:hypothetical protein
MTGKSETRDPKAEVGKGIFNRRERKTQRGGQGGFWIGGLLDQWISEVRSAECGVRGGGWLILLR